MPTTPLLQRFAPLLRKAGGLGLFIGAVVHLGILHPWTVDLSPKQSNSCPSWARTSLNRIQSPIEVLAFAKNPEDRWLLTEQLGPWIRANPAFTLSFIEKPPLALSGQGSFVTLRSGPSEKSLFVDQWMPSVTRDPRRPTPFIPEPLLFQTFMRVAYQESHWVGFSQGHGEKNPHGKTSQGYSQLAELLTQAGIHWAPVVLHRLEQLPDNLSCLLIAQPSSELLDSEKRVLEKYLLQGGHVLLFHEGLLPTTWQFLTDHVNLQLYEYPIHNDYTGSSQIEAHPAFTILDDYPPHPALEGFHSLMLLPWAYGLKLKAGASSFEVKPLFWSKEHSFILYPDQKKKGPFLLGASFEKRFENPVRQQKITVIGNSRFLSNGVIHNAGNRDLALHLLTWYLTPPLAPNSPSNLTAQTTPAASEPSLRLSKGSAFLLAWGAPLLFWGIIPCSLGLYHYVQSRKKLKPATMQPPPFSGKTA